MSKGPGAVERWIVETLRERGGEGASTAGLHYMRLASQAQGTPHTLRRSARHSLTRALRSLEAAGTIKCEGIDKKWTLTGAPLRKPGAERIMAAYHEAGHAVVARSRQLPVGFATIKSNGRWGGYVTGIHDRPNAVGAVTKRVPKQLTIKDGRKTRTVSYMDHEEIADLRDVDAFGNPLPKSRLVSPAEHTAEILMCIAGGMAEAVHKGDDPMTWRKLASNADVSIARFHMYRLAKSKAWNEYAADTLVLIRKHWPMIEAVAADLLKHETLSGFDIDDICRSVARRVVRKQHLKRAA
jgi:hypothetical protein